MLKDLFVKEKWFLFSASRCTDYKHRPTLRLPFTSYRQSITYIHVYAFTACLQAVSDAIEFTDGIQINLSIYLYICLSHHWRYRIDYPRLGRLADMSKGNSSSLSNLSISSTTHTNTDNTTAILGLFNWASQAFWLCFLCLLFYMHLSHLINVAYIHTHIIWQQTVTQ